MTSRTFPEVSITAGGQQVKAMKIGCSECEAVGYYAFQSGHKRRPPVAAVQHFQNKDWVVGSTPRKDLCPVHAKLSRKKGTKAMADATAPTADKPREMTRDDRRIINDKLDEVYANDAYKSPWSDSAVARDLGVPRDWVAQVREAFFGEAGTNPLFDEFLSAKTAIEQGMTAVVALQDAAIKKFDACTKELADLRKKLDDLRILGRRIEKEIGR
ncbi:hypothetical protein [Rhizobium sp. RCAM05973]|uniref:hypothetical protein n=1 Tax=Rhizobium sp. RCAM05973 TaxID=2994066 RepID=UPI0022EBB822|nr:hypothetical protein [Rhizobium sp. RCAM05973]